MKQNIRRILAVLVLAVSVLGLSACGSAASPEDEFPMEEAYLQSVANGLIADWNSAEDELLTEIAEADADILEDTIEYYRSMGHLYGCFTAESLKTAYAGYLGSREELGAYQSTDGFEPMEIKGEGATVVANLTYENRQASLSLVFNKRGVVESATLDPKYSTGEILKKAGMNTILGMGTVFIVLIFISLVIYCFNFIPGNRAKQEEEKPESKPKAPKKPGKKPAGAPAGGNLVDDKELVAAITAAICAYTGTSSEGFVVRSIKRAKTSKWKKEKNQLL